MSGRGYDRSLGYGWPSFDRSGQFYRTVLAKSESWALPIKPYDPPGRLGLSVTITGNTTATLTWSASPTAGVTTYSIFRRTPPTGIPFVPTVAIPIAVGVAATTYNDTGLTLGTQYEWEVFGEI